jgi:hypothetical protein
MNKLWKDLKRYQFLNKFNILGKSGLRQSIGSNRTKFERKRTWFWRTFTIGSRCHSRKVILFNSRELSQAELKKYEHKKEAVKELRKAYLDDKRRAIESREDVK